MLRAIGAYVRAGRTLERRDVGAQSRTIVVNERLAKRFGLGSDPEGKTVVHKTPQGQTRYEVIGVIGDLREHGFGQVTGPVYYRPYQEIPLGLPHFMTIRTTTKPSVFFPSLSKELKNLELTIDSPRFEIVAAKLYNSTAYHRLYTKCLAVAAAVGLLLAALGIYGVMAHSIALRTKEMGIRLALGALPYDIIRNTMRQSIGTVAVGIAVGLLGTFWLSRFIEFLLFDISPQDPLILTGAIAVFITVAAFAAWIPARRAARTDPMVALRHE